MAQHTVSVAVAVSVRVAWWVRWYLSGVAFAALISGATPDAIKVSGWIRRGLSVCVIRRP